MTTLPKIEPLEFAQQSTAFDHHDWIFAKDAILDGELVVLDGSGKARFCNLMLWTTTCVTSSASTMAHIEECKARGASAKHHEAALKRLRAVNR